MDVDGFMICATPRTGSTLLCGLLEATGAGAPDSFFMRDPIPAWAEAWGLPRDGSGPEGARAHLAAARRAGRGAGREGTRVFGLRLMGGDRDALLALIDRAHPGHASDRARIEAAFGRILFVHLARRDRLAQAVSLVRALQTGLWHRAADGSELERIGPPGEAAFDAGRIAEALAGLKAEDAGWEAWFADGGIAPHRILYEDLAADPGPVLAALCRALGLAVRDEAPRPRVARLADAESVAWLLRFQEEGG